MEFLQSSNDFNPDPDLLFMVSDYSEIGLKIKQSIKFKYYANDFRICQGISQLNGYHGSSEDPTAYNQVII